VQPILLKTREVALLFRVSCNTVWLWYRDGRLPGLRVGRDLRFRRRDVEALLGTAVDSIDTKREVA
jgi:excisionase family DNA binding protein